MLKGATHSPWHTDRVSVTPRGEQNLEPGRQCHRILAAARPDRAPVEATGQPAGAKDPACSWPDPLAACGTCPLALRATLLAASCFTMTAHKTSVYLKVLLLKSTTTYLSAPHATQTEPVTPLPADLSGTR